MARNVTTMPPKVAELVERFERNRSAYMADQYKEAQLRQEFIDPLFEALGWDMANVQGYAEAYKDVVHEASLKTSGGTKAPDYCFRVGGNRKFFVEAKKPSVNIRMAAEPAYQLRRYAWSAKLPLSILTNFDGIAVYDCTVPPRQLEDPAVARVKYIGYGELLTRWTELEELFGKESVLRGLFDSFAASNRSKRGTQEVDDAFLSAIDSWRTDLAKNISRRNSSLSGADLNWVVQQTIDRIVFLRICEDRGIEGYGQLRDAVTAKDGYGALAHLFRRADDRYNSGLFHFRPERHREPPDTLSLSLAIDSTVLRRVIGALYYPESPYEFSVLPLDILGHVYEQFLGKHLTLDEKRVLRVEYKPEVAKAGGVYYTPAPIARHITELTVGPLLEGLDVEPLRDGPARLRIVDPSCGSGTFLLVAYERLMDWYLESFRQDPGHWTKQSTPPIREDGAGGWRLTTAEKKSILLRHIFGVDLDPRAVEVTKLSLLLKVLEGESQESVDRQIELFHERALPDLDANVKCGNSLVHPAYVVSGPGKDLSAADRAAINPFNWDEEFPEAFAEGGFDAVIGNPPWLMAGYHVKPVLPHFASAYSTARGKYDMYYLFIEKSLELVNAHGRVGLIVPNKFFHTRAARELRGLLSQSKRLERVLDFGEEQVFARATNYSAIVILGSAEEASVSFERVRRDLNVLEKFVVDADALSAAPWHFDPAPRRERHQRVSDGSQPLKEFVTHFGNGVQTGADRILLVSPATAEELGLEPQLMRPFLRGRDVRRYGLRKPRGLVIFPYRAAGALHVLLSESELQEYPAIYAYLLGHRKALDQRTWFGKSATELSGAWYGLMYVDRPAAFQAGHLVTPSLALKTNFAMGDGSPFATGTAGVTSATVKGETDEAYFLMAVLNSNLVSNYATARSPVFRGGYRKFSTRYIEDLPIKGLSGPSADVAAFERLVELSRRRAALAMESDAATNAHTRGLVSREADEVESEIDRKVFELYRLPKADVAALLDEEGQRVGRGKPRDDRSTGPPTQPA